MGGGRGVDRSSTREDCGGDCNGGVRWDCRSAEAELLAMRSIRLLFNEENVNDRRT